MSATSILRSHLDERVITAGDPDYDEARTVFSGAVDRRPAAIVRAASPDDVARVVTLARETGLELAVRGGGHSPAGHGATEGGIVLDLSGLRALAMDVDRRTAWAQAGLTAGEYTTAAAAHGLATGFGDTGSVGIAGITLAGGIGYLVRRHGLTVDSLLAAEVVTADGELVHADARTHPDLFWALRGGGGNFGVVTRMQFRLHEVGTITGGLLMLPATPEVIAGFVAAAQAAPEDLSAIASVMPAPPLPFVPAEQHGRLVLLATFAHVGSEHAIAPFRALADPLVDLVRPMAYPELFPAETPGRGPAGALRTVFADDVDRRAAEAIIEQLAERAAPMAAVQLRVLGGAMARVPADATAFAHRDRRIMINVGAMYGHLDEAPVHEAWVDGLAGTLRQGRPGAYAGFLGDEGEARVRAAYPDATWDRLAAIKARYDPDNVFRLNQNIPPAAREPTGVIARSR